MNLFQGNGIKKTYRQGKKDGFSLDVPELIIKSGEITGVVGENGNGKTTLLRIIAGLLSVDDGILSYYESGFNAFQNWQQIKHSIAYIPHQLKGWGGTLYESMLFLCAIKGVPAEEIEARCESLLERLGISQFRNHQYKELSGGYKMRAELARVLVWGPDLLVLDEPLANLDVKAQTTFLKDLKDLTHEVENKFGVIVSSQHLYKIENAADHILFLKQGKVLFNGPVTDIGKERTENCLEVNCGLNKEELEQVLQETRINRIEHEGTHWLIYTPLDVTPVQILKLLIDKGIDVQFFRNISQSTRQLFETI